MSQRYPLIIDTYAHITPPRYIKALQDTGMDTPHVSRPALYDLDARFRIMDKYEGLLQVLTVGLPPVSGIEDKAKALDVARIANDEMAELVLKYPDRFVAAIAAVPMVDMDDALGEVDRAVKRPQAQGR